SSVDGAGAAACAPLTAVRAAAAPSRPASLLSIIPPWKGHLPARYAMATIHSRRSLFRHAAVEQRDAAVALRDIARTRSSSTPRRSDAPTSPDTSGAGEQVRR